MHVLKSVREGRHDEGRDLIGLCRDTGIQRAYEQTLNALPILAKAEEREVVALGFGTFQCSQRKARTGRNPRSGKEINIPACSVPRFKPGNKLREALK
jgi:nucleoid DNA-binding protein